MKQRAPLLSFNVFKDPFGSEPKLTLQQLWPQKRALVELICAQNSRSNGPLIIDSPIERSAKHAWSSFPAMKPTTIPSSAIFLVGFFLLSSVLLPLPFAVLAPGGGTDVLKTMITIPSQQTFPANGKLLLTTVYATSPASRIFGGDILRSWIDGESIVLPRDVIYPRAKSTKQIDAENTAQMLDSQEAAKVSALSYLGFSISRSHVKNSAGKIVLKYTLPFPISIDLKKTGGPSGGLVFALGIVTKLSTEDFLKGRTVAGTGTIDAKGHVGPIGGIGDKLIAARRAGASVFLAPIENCRDIKYVPAGLKVYSVATLQEAVSVLKNAGNSRSNCTSQQIR